MLRSSCYFRYCCMFGRLEKRLVNPALNNAQGQVRLTTELLMKLSTI